MKSSRVKYPEIRLEIIECINDLSDPNVQKAVWLNQENWPAVGYGNLSHVIMVLYDIAELNDDHPFHLGEVFVDENEVREVKNLMLALNEARQLHGDATDEEYITSSDWSNVIVAAGSAKAALAG